MYVLCKHKIFSYHIRSQQKLTRLNKNMRIYHNSSYCIASVCKFIMQSKSIVLNALFFFLSFVYRMSEAAKAYENCDRSFKPVFAEPRPQNKDNNSYSNEFNSRGGGGGGGGGGSGHMDMRGGDRMPVELYRPNEGYNVGGECNERFEKDGPYVLSGGPLIFTFSFFSLGLLVRLVF